MGQERVVRPGDMAVPFRAGGVDLASLAGTGHLLSGVTGRVSAELRPRQRRRAPLTERQTRGCAGAFGGGDGVP